MRKTLIAAITALSLLYAAPRAEAKKDDKFFEVWAAGTGGGGWGTGTTHKDFFNYAKGAAVGAEAGVKIWFVSAFVDYQYWPGYWAGGAEGAHLLGFNLGGDIPLNLVGDLDLVIRISAGYYYGILPDDNTIKLDDVPITYVNTRGIGVRGGAGLRYRFAANFLSIGIKPEIGYHYFFGGAHDSIYSDNSHGFDIKGILYLRLSLGA